MIDPRIAWFAMGATFGLVLCGWPWHPRFSRVTRMGPPRGSYGLPPNHDWRFSFTHENHNAQESEYLIPDDRIYYVRSRPQIIFDEE